MQPVIDICSNNNNYNCKENDKQFKFKFSKMNGAGNDFVVFHINKVKRINGGDDTIPVTVEEISKVATKISNRKFGIGCDQLIIVDDSPNSLDANYAMHVINCDGVIEMMCGNGVRCATKYLLDNNIKSNQKQYNVNENQGEQLIETKSGIIKTYPLLNHKDTNYNDSLLMVKVNMGKARLVSTTTKCYNNQILEKSNIPSRESFIHTIDNLGLEYCDKIEFALIGCGGAHAVVFIDRNIELGYLKGPEFIDTPLHLIKIKELADKIQEHPLFKSDTIPNVEFVAKQSINDKENNKLDSRVVERGSGETLACGTGACGVAIAALLLNLVHDNNDITVQMPGGNLLIQWSSNNDVFKIGPAQTSFNSEFIV